MVARVLRGALPACAAAVLAASCDNSPVSRTPVASANDLRHTAGALTSAGLTVSLEARTAMWRPSSDSGPEFEVAAFAESGKSPSIPGPLLRLPVGGSVSISLANRLADTLLVTGLLNPQTSDTLLVAPGATVQTSFRASRPGLYGYAGRTRRGPQSWFGGRGGQLAGVIAVDSVGAPPDRIFAITAWNGAPPIGGDSTFFLTMNGKMWPHTERLRLAVGDTAHWRVINFAGSVHPMHLHGVYFRVDARGGRTGDTAYARSQQRLAVTEVLDVKESMTITWSPQRSGHWLFHCHDAFHVAHVQEENLSVASRMWAASLRGDTTPLAGDAHRANGMTHDMSGLVMGIDVSGPAPAAPPAQARPIALTIQQRAKVYGDSLGVGFVLAQPGTVAPDSISIPGPLLVLQRDQPVAITVHNRLPMPTSVHWHGLELDSYFDGVGGWSGTAQRTAPPIAPGDSFVARFTPPRAGTFIYHSHFSEVWQLSSGLYGPLVVLDSGRTFDAARDRVVLFAVAGTTATAKVVAHYSKVPLARGVPHRFRFIDIAAGDGVEVELLQDDKVMTWRQLAKDGADLPVVRASPARFRLSPGETLDAEIVPARGPVVLRVKSYNNFEATIPVQKQ